MILFLLPALGFSGSMTSGGVALYTLPFCSASSRFNSQSLTFSTSSPNPSASANACKNQSYSNTNSQKDFFFLPSIYPQCKINLQNILLKQRDNNICNIKFLNILTFSLASVLTRLVFPCQAYLFLASRLTISTLSNTLTMS